MAISVYLYLDISVAWVASLPNSLLQIIYGKRERTLSLVSSYYWSVIKPCVSMWHFLAYVKWSTLQFFSSSESSQELREVTAILLKYAAKDCCNLPPWMQNILFLAVWKLMMHFDHQAPDTIFHSLTALLMLYSTWALVCLQQVLPSRCKIWNNFPHN